MVPSTSGRVSARRRVIVLLQATLLAVTMAIVPAAPAAAADPTAPPASPSATDPAATPTPAPDPSVAPAPSESPAASDAPTPAPSDAATPTPSESASPPASDPPTAAPSASPTPGASASPFPTTKSVRRTADSTGFSVVSATPSGADVARASQIQLTFSSPIDPATFAGAINGHPIVPTEVVVSSGQATVTVDPGELEYGRTYAVTIAATVAAASGDATLGAAYAIRLHRRDQHELEASNDDARRPHRRDAGRSTLTRSAEPRPATSGSATPTTRSSSATGTPTEPTRASPMLHPTVLYFPERQRRLQVLALLHAISGRDRREPGDRAVERRRELHRRRHSEQPPLHLRAPAPLRQPEPRRPRALPCRRHVDALLRAGDARVARELDRRLDARRGLHRRRVLGRRQDVDALRRPVHATTRPTRPRTPPTNGNPIILPESAVRVGGLRGREVGRANGRVQGRPLPHVADGRPGELGRLRHGE